MIYIFVRGLRYRSSEQQIRILRDLNLGGCIRWYPGEAMVVTKLESYAILQISVGALLNLGLIKQVTHKGRKTKEYKRTDEYCKVIETKKVTRVLEI